MSLLKLLKKNREIKQKLSLLKQLEKEYIDANTNWGLESARAINLNDKEYLKHRYVFFQKNLKRINDHHAKIRHSLFKDQKEREEFLASPLTKKIYHLAKQYNEHVTTIIMVTFITQLILIFLYYKMG